MTSIQAKAQSKADHAMQKLITKHPLQRLTAPSRSVSALLHILGLSSFAYSYKYLVDNPSPISASYGWHFQYLTIIGLTLSTLTFLTGLLADLSLSPRLFRLKNTLAVASLPLNLLISLLYWSLRLIDPELVVPKELDLPTRADLGFHAAPFAFLFVDVLVLSPPWTIAVVPALGLSSLIAFGYWFWIERCYAVNGFYPYPLLEMLGRSERMALFGGSAVAMAGSTAVIQWVYRRVNGVEMGRRS